MKKKNSFVEDLEYKLEKAKIYQSLLNKDAIVKKKKKTKALDEINKEIKAFIEEQLMDLSQQEESASSKKSNDAPIKKSSTKSKQDKRSKFYEEFQKNAKAVDLESYSIPKESMCLIQGEVVATKADAMLPFLQPNNEGKIVRAFENSTGDVFLEVNSRGAIGIFNFDDVVVR